MSIDFGIKTTTPTQDSQPLPFLPQAIVFAILSRLPVKYLVQFRSVCKSWLSLISSPQFVKSHLSIASHRGDQRLVLNTFPDFTGLNPDFTHTELKSCSLDSAMECHLPENAVELDYPFKNHNRFVVLVGSCNGLLCVADRDTTIFLLNPSSRTSKILPARHRRGGEVLYGFGFDESNDDYKVVLIYNDSVGGVVSAERQVMVYTLRTDSWRQIGGFSYDASFRALGEFLNGLLHWVVCDNSDSSYSHVIVSLGLEKEMVGQLLLPNYGDVAYDLELCILQGSLGVLCMCQLNCTHVWIMKVYGMTDSWTQLFIIPDVAKPWIRQISSRLCISKNGEVFIIHGQQFCIYSPKNGTFRKLVIQNGNHCLQMLTYVESLVPLNVDNVVQRGYQ